MYVLVQPDKGIFNDVPGRQLPSAFATRQATNRRPSAASQAGQLLSLMRPDALYYETSSAAMVIMELLNWLSEVGCWPLWPDGSVQGKPPQRI
jgi:hypothetical protein